MHAIGSMLSLRCLAAPRSIHTALVLAALGVASCASTPPAKSSASATTPIAPAASPAPAAVPVTSSAEVNAAPQAVCDLVCERAQIVPRAVDEPDYTARATDNANQVLAAMHDDLLACYKRRVSVNPQAHGFITVDIVIDPNGKVSGVETTGGAILGDATMSCITKRIQRATFDPPHGGGTLRIHVPFSLRRVAPDDDTL